MAGLTVKEVQHAKEGRHLDGAGLYLDVKASGAAAWVFRYKRDGRVREMGLGAARGPDTVTLADARKQRAALRAQLAAGLDPATEKRRAELESRIHRSEERTFRAVTETYIKNQEAGWRNVKHRQQWRNTLATYAYPKIGDMNVADIETEHVLNVLRPIWSKKPETAQRVRGRIERILAAATSLGYRQGFNPAIWRGHLQNLLAKPQKLSRGHHNALPYQSMPAFMRQLGEQEGIAARALEFAIFTATRTGEVIGAQWAEINMAEAVWAIPASRMKAGREHRVPLSEQALAIVSELPRLSGNPHIFPGQREGRGLSNMAMTSVIRRMNVQHEGRLVTVHGFRSSLREWAANETGFPREVCEMSLAHNVKDKAEAAYWRGDILEKRRDLIAAWGRYCSGSAIAEANVVPFRAG